jgi:N-methylhydantoinase A
VGPESAGADPGPIAYGLGGQEPTVTDAHVWLGRLPSRGFLGGEGSLDKDAIRDPLKLLSERLGKTPEEAAEGILDVANTAMERALRVISVERGFDPEEFVLVAFGGAGALHVAELTRRLGASRALVPPDPGLLSAYGMLAAPPTREASRTLLLHSQQNDVAAQLDQAFQELESRAMGEMLEEGNLRDDLHLECWVDARYRGQSFEIRVARENWVEAFHTAHLERYGYARRDTPVEAVTLRAVAQGAPLPLEHDTLPPAEGPPAATEESVYYAGETVPAKVLWRRDLRPGHVLHGPALVMEYSSTTWLPPDWRLEVDRWGSLHLSKE